MRVKVAEQVFDVRIKWKIDKDGDHSLSVGFNGKKLDYWGIVCPHHEGRFEVVGAWGDVQYSVYDSLEEAKNRAERSAIYHLVSQYHIEIEISKEKP